MGRYTNRKRWFVGVDVGQCSLGICAVEVDGDDTPISILSIVSWIHDGGKDNSTGETPRSRKVIAGVNRREQNREAHRNQRLMQLRSELQSLGIPYPDEDNDSARLEPWEDRALLVAGRIEDESEMNIRLGRAITHIAKNRGWRNPWWSVDRVSKLTVPSSSFCKIRDRAVKQFGDSAKDLRTLGQIGYLSVKQAGQIGSKEKSRFRPLLDSTTGKFTDAGIVQENIRQEDLIAEVKLICETQGLSDDVCEKLCSAIFYQVHPYVKAGNVGRDPFFSDQLRAPKATLEFQEFRIRDKVANLRVQGRNVENNKLPKEKRDEIVDLLLHWDGDKPPTWEEVSDMCGLPSNQRLKTDSVDKSNSHSAPIDDTSRLMRTSGLVDEWNKLPKDEQADFIASWVDTVPLDEDIDPDQDIVSLVMDRLTDSQQDEMERISFQGDRAAYSRETLQRLNEIMAETGCDQTTARWDAFKDVMGWQDEEEARRWTPPKNTFYEATENPTVDINIGLVRRYLQTATAKWGPPERVVIEHSRNGFMSPQKVQEEIVIQSARRDDNDIWRQKLTDDGLTVSDSNIRRYKLLERQNGACLYCGTEVTFTESEIDHIVCRSTGGSNRESNLVLVCPGCNRSKTNKTFSLWVKNNDRRATLEATIERVNAWTDVGMENVTKKINKQRAAQRAKKGEKVAQGEKKGEKVAQREEQISLFANLKKDVIKRLKRTDEDDLIDERSMESTAWAAVAVRERVEDFLEKQVKSYPDYDPKGVVHVYNGRITSLAREYSGFSKTVALRGQEKKIRWDRRHHALDALIVTSLRPSVAKTLAEKGDMKDADSLRSSPTKKHVEYEGSSDGDRVLYGQWMTNVKKLAGLAKDALEHDRIPVSYVSRTSPYYEPKHKVRGSKLIKRKLGDSFSSDEVRRVADKHFYMALLKHLEYDEKNGFKTNPGRTLVLSDGRTLGGNSVIGLYPASKSGRKPKDPSIDPNAPKVGKAAMLSVKRGASELSYVHHARVYAWETTSNSKKEEPEYSFGIVRVFAGEFPRMGFLKDGADVFTKALPEWSESYRLSDETVLSKLKSGEAKQIGWLLAGDELEFGSGFLSQIKGNNSIKAFTSTYPADNRWVVSGMPLTSSLTLSPSYLSQETLVKKSKKSSSKTTVSTTETLTRDTSDESAGDDVDDSTKTDPALKVVESGWDVKMKKIFADPDLKIIRRSILGVPRWHDTWNQEREKERLPKSWQPHLEAKRLLG